MFAMGDISNETSMEDILSSIKRIIAEEGESALTRSTSRKPRRSVNEDAREDEAPRRDPADAVLELREAVAEAVDNPDRVARYAAEQSTAQRVSEAEERDESDYETEPQQQEARASQPAPKVTNGAGKVRDDDTILSRQAADASRGQLEALSRLIVKPDVAGSDTLEGLVREMLRPMLRDWLDANLPAMVERMVQREIARITERDS